MPSTSQRQPSLVGRAGELALLEGLVRHARRGGGVAVVEGEAGIGKTRLVEAALEAARDAGATVLASRAEELEAHRPFGAIVDFAGHERLEPYLGVWERGPDVAGERQFRVAEAVLELLDELCARGPVVVAVEDLHWADPATIGVLARVVAGLEWLPAALVLSLRPEPRRPELGRLLGILAARQATPVRLGPLDDAALEQLLEGLLDARPGARLVRQARRAGGNPLFVGELVGALAAAGAIARGEGGAELASEDAVPSLPVTIMHRLSFLEAAVLELLGLASVLGTSFVAADLALLAGRPVSQLVPVLRAAQRAGVLAEQGERVAFRHELIRDALYEDMPLSVRRGLHTELAAALADAGEPPERIAEHLLRGAERGDARAIRALIGAARDLVGRAPGAAVDLYRQAIGLSADPPARRRELLPELAEALMTAGLLDEGEAACREALALDVDPHWAGRLRLALMFLLSRRARLADAVAEGEAALASPDLAEVDRARLRALTSVARVSLADVEPALRDAGAVLEASGDELACALATKTLAAAAFGRGAFAQAADLIAPIMRWADRTGSRAAQEVRPHMLFSLTLMHLDRLDEAEATIQRARHAAESLGIANALPVVHYYLALLHFSRGRLDDAVAELTTRAQLAEQAGTGWHLPAESLLALIALHRDDLLTAERHVAAAEAEAAAGQPWGTDLMVLARAGLLTASGNPGGALDALVGKLEASVGPGFTEFVLVLGPELARAAVATGRPERAAPVVPKLERIAALNPGAPRLQAAPLLARGLVEPDTGVLLSALDLLRQSGRELEAARAAEDAAALARNRAPELLEEARAAYERCRAPRDLARVEAALRGIGAPRGVRGARRRPETGWEALTDTELRVVRLVAERLTNPEIAERMFISRRTVQTHVSHALAKLGVASRRELAAEAARRAGWRLRVEGVVEQAEQAEPAVEPPRRPVVDGDHA